MTCDESKETSFLEASPRHETKPDLTIEEDEEAVAGGKESLETGGGDAAAASVQLMPHKDREHLRKTFWSNAALSKFSPMKS